MKFQFVKRPKYGSVKKIIANAIAKLGIRADIGIVEMAEIEPFGDNTFCQSGYKVEYYKW